MILTLTLNPSLDKTIKVNRWKWDSVQEVQEIKYTAGGKGINVSRILTSFNIPNTALFLQAGNTGQQIKRLLEQENIVNRGFKEKGINRSNTTISYQNKEIHLLEEGPHLTKSFYKRIEKRLKILLPKVTYLILSGSLPPGSPPGTYRKLINLAQEYGVKSILDTRSQPLQEGVKAKPWMIKPNLEELQYLTGINSRGQIQRAAQKLISQGIEVVVVSLGKQGALLFTQSKVWKAVPPPITCSYSVGCGDALLAGIIIKILPGEDWSMALKWGVACGAANCLRAGAGVVDKKDIAEIYPRVNSISLPPSKKLPL